MLHQLQGRFHSSSSKVTAAAKKSLQANAAAAEKTTATPKKHSSVSSYSQNAASTKHIQQRKGVKDETEGRPGRQESKADFVFVSASRCLT